jgi:hypothetical protein
MTIFVPQPNIDVSKTSKRLWMIIDGALLNDAHKVLPSQFANKKQHIEYKSVFQKSRWHDVADVGPLLISYDKEIEAWAQSQRPWHFGLIFESDQPLKTLTQYWLTLSECQHQGLEGSLCRLYDGMIFYHLLNQAEETRQASWLGPMQKVWIPDYVNQHYLLAEKPNVKNALPLEKVTFTDPEWQGLSDAKRYLSAYKLTQHVDEFFPDYWLDKADKHAHALEQLSLLNDLGEVTQQGATYYMNILCRIGDIWNLESKKADNDKDRPHEEIVALLEQTSTESLTDRLEAANQLALTYHLNELRHKEASA